MGSAINSACSSASLLQVCNNWAELEQFTAAWQELLSRNQQLTIFSTPEWLGPWWRAYGDGKQLFAPVFIDSDGNVIGIAPLYLDKRRLRPFGSLSHLRLVGAGSGDSDALDVLVSPGSEAAVSKALFAWLRQLSGWDIFSLETVQEHSSFLQTFRAVVPKSTYFEQADRTPNLSIPLPSTWEEYLKRVPSETRPLLTRYPRRLESRYKVEVLHCTAIEELAANLEVLFALHQKRWAQAGHSGSFAGNQRRQFYIDMGGRLLGRGWLEFWLLKMDGRITAAQFCFRHRSTVYLLQEGFDPEYAQDRVGYVLRAKVLQHVISQGAQHYDFLAGAEGTDAYKNKFAAQINHYQSVSLARNGSLGSMQMMLNRRTKLMKSWIRKKLPAGLSKKMNARGGDRH